MELIGACLMVTVMAIFTYGMYKIQQDRYNYRKSLSDDGVVMDQVQEDSYNGNPVWLTEAERELWNGLSRETKREIIRKVQKRIKNGELYVHTDEEGFTGLITVKEAIKKGYIKNGKEISD